MLQHVFVTAEITGAGIFTMDTLVAFLKKTFLNPILTVPIFLALQYIPAGRDILQMLGNDAMFQMFKVLVTLGVIGRINRYLSWGVQNNWSGDVFCPSEEIVVVTGGSSGIGAAIVKELIAPGVGIKAVVVLDVQPLMFTAAKNVSFFNVDLSSIDGIAAVCERVRSEVGNPTVLINNAGICRGKTVLHATPADIQLTFAVNTISHFCLVQQFLPAMIKRNHGHIVTVSSIGAYLAAPQMVDYNASKAATQGFHEGIALELKHRYNAPKVRTTLVSQGYVKTPLFLGFKNDSKFLLPSLEPETVAEAIAEKIFQAEGGQVVLPAGMNIMTVIRGWPIWMHKSLLDTTHDMMAKFNGRQVI